MHWRPIALVVPLQVLGGVLMHPAYVQHALHLEGKADCGADISHAKLVIAKLQGPEPTFVPVTEVGGAAG